eukprot:scaffold397_cov403-Prasinococcus_capsulatus_cf.AAC.1
MLGTGAGVEDGWRMDSLWNAAGRRHRHTCRPSPRRAMTWPLPRRDGARRGGGDDDAPEATPRDADARAEAPRTG